MAKNGPECACGEGSGPEERKIRILFPCAGLANVGQISNCAALQLTEEGYGNATCIALLGSGNPGLMEGIAGANEVVIIDGCSNECGKKIADSQGVGIAQHLIITGLGIEKVHSQDYTEDDIEKVVSAAWEGKGRVQDD
ncbi:MAG TPA: putative zinc-binding protein [Methanoregulaceae archaeon]|nr:putative zinc-binding protein [Methanoregulaceae archaeon]